MDQSFLKQHHDAGLPYAQYLAAGTETQRDNWQAIHEQLTLTDVQRRLVEGFSRRMPVLVLSGRWCGDCVQQGPMLERIAEANRDTIDLRWLERDDHPDLQQRTRINAGDRVPVVIICAEDYELVAWHGDSTLSRYRAMAASQLGASCPRPGAPVPRDELNGALADWLAHFERAHLLLRLSSRLRQLHGD